jgi:hypothetical protein
MTSWQPAELVAQEGGQEVRDEMARLHMAMQARVLGAWEAQQARLGPAWAGGADFSDYVLRLRPDQARELGAELSAVLTRWLEAHPGDQPADEGTELVVVLTDVVPLKEMPL